MFDNNSSSLGAMTCPQTDDSHTGVDSSNNTIMTTSTTCTTGNSSSGRMDEGGFSEFEINVKRGMKENENTTEKDKKINNIYTQKSCEKLLKEDLEVIAEDEREDEDEHVNVRNNAVVNSNRKGILEHERLNRRTPSRKKKKSNDNNNIQKIIITTKSSQRLLYLNKIQLYENGKIQVFVKI
eukprot:UN30938